MDSELNVATSCPRELEGFFLGKQTNKTICLVNNFSVWESKYFYLHEEIYKHHNV